MNAIKLQLSADQSSVAANDPVTIKFTITNTSKETLPIAGPFDWTVLRDGKRVADTEEGLRWKEARHARQTVNVPLELNAGASSKQTEILSNLYVMNVPGVYHVTMQIEVSDLTKTSYIKSNTVQIIVR